MNSTGRYVLQYQPSNNETEYLQTAIEMSISDEATIGDMTNFFDCFLKAAGYIYDGSVKVVDDPVDHFLFNPYNNFLTLDDEVVTNSEA